MTLCLAIKETNNNSPLAPFNGAARNARGATIPTSGRNKALLFAVIGTIYQVFPPARKGYVHVDRQNRRQSCRRARRQEAC
jgi:hypothetical protein